MPILESSEAHGWTVNLCEWISGTFRAAKGGRFTVKAFSHDSPDDYLSYSTDKVTTAGVVFDMTVYAVKHGGAFPDQMSKDGPR